MQTADSAHIKKAMVYLSKNFRNTPDKEDIAKAAGTSWSCFRQLFTRWAGVGPEPFLRLLAVDHAREILLDGGGAGNSAFQADTRGEAARPRVASLAELQKHDAEIVIRYGVHDGPLGPFFMALMEEGVCALTFLERSTVRKEAEKLREIWGRAEILEDTAGTSEAAERIFYPRKASAGAPLTAVVNGTDFQVKVWKALVRIPAGRALSYEELASSIGAPRAARAAGSACARNQVSYIIPCHRVIRKTGAFGRYGGGEGRKRVLLALEAAQQAVHLSRNAFPTG